MMEIVDYNALQETLPENLPGRVYLWDETLRDGEQTPGVWLTPQEKIEIAKLMDEVGISIITVGYPAVSPGEKKSVRLISREKLSANIAAPARPVRSDIDACIEAEVEEIPIFIGISNLMLKILGVSKEGAKERVEKSVEYVKEHGILPDFVAMDASRCDLSFLLEISLAARKAGADKICFADTVGFLRPLSTKVLISKARERLWKEERFPLSIHCHNDFGLATANTLSAIEEGVEYPHTGVNGFGERSGNAPLEEVVMALEVLYKIKTGIKTEKLWELSKLVEKSFSVLVPVHKALVGKNSFSHEAGIHVHGQLLHPLAFEPIPPETVGRTRKFFLGKFTGAHLVSSKLQEKGIKVSKDEVREIVRRVKKLHEEKSKNESIKNFEEMKRIVETLQAGVTEDEFWKIVEDVMG